MNAPYLARSHVRDGSVSLHALKLIQTPIQFLQSLNRKFDNMILIWKEREPFVQVVLHDRMTFNEDPV